MTPQRAKAGQDLLNAHRGGRVLAVTITYEEWMKGTDLGAVHPRSNEIKAVDQALKNYWTQGKTESAFVHLKNAFDNWIRAQERKGSAWTQSDRNKHGMVSKLHEQILLCEGGRSVRLMQNAEDFNARLELIQAEREAIKTLFHGRRLVFKSEVKAGITKVTNAIVMPVISSGIAVRGAVTATQGAVTPHTISTLATNVLGQAPSPVFNALGHSFSGFCSSGAAIAGAALAPALLLKDIAVMAMKVNERVTANTERVVFRPGNADEAVNSIIRLIDREIALCGIDMGQQVASIVASCFHAGPIAGAANALVSTLVSLKVLAMMTKEMEHGNRMLTEGNYTLDLFNASPVLGSYFLIMADTSVWVNFSAFDIGTPGWKDTVEKLVKRAEPVIDKARELIRVTKYALSGTEGFRGLEWEASWRNNKVEFLLNYTEPDHIAGKLYQGGKAVVNKIRS